MGGGAARVALAVGALVHLGAAVALAIAAAAWPWFDPGATFGFRLATSGVGAGLALLFGVLGAATAAYGAARLPQGGAAVTAGFVAGALLVLSCWPLGLVVLGLLAARDDA